MKEYFEAMENYINLKIKYANLDLENDLKYRKEFHELANTKSEMETRFIILMNKKQDR
jgi:hypothetical protein